MSNACEYAEISNALFNTSHTMTMTRWLCRVLLVHIREVRMHVISDVTRNFTSNLA